MILDWTTELDAKLIEQFTANSKSKVKDYKQHLNLQKLTKKEIRARLEFLKLKKKGAMMDEDWESFSNSYVIKQMVAPAPEKEAEQVEEKDDSDQPISLAPTISKVDLIKRDLLESAIVTKGKMPIEELKEKGFVKEMANQSLKDFKSFKFEDKSLPSNGNVRKLLKTLTKSVVTPSKKKDVKNIVAKLESAVAEVPQEKNLTPSMMAAVTKNSAARAKKQLFKAKNNAFGHLNSAATRSTPSLRAASAAQRTTKSRLDINLKFDQKMEQPMTPSYLAAKNAKKASEKFVKSAETKGEDRSLAWTPSRKAAQKAEKVTKSMLDFEAILLKRSKQGTALDEPTSKHENHSKENDFDGESFEVENNENSPIFTQTAKEIETVYVSTRRSPRHKRISEIPMGLKLKPMQSSPLRKLIVFDPDEVSPVVFNSPLRNVLKPDVSSNLIDTSRKRKRESRADFELILETPAEKKSKFQFHVAPVDELKGRNSFLGGGLYKFASNFATGIGY